MGLRVWLFLAGGWLPPLGQLLCLVQLFRKGLEHFDFITCAHAVLLDTLKNCALPFLQHKLERKAWCVVLAGFIQASEVDAQLH